MKSGTDDFDELLRSWKEVPEATGKLAQPVWARIEATTTRRVWLSSLALRLHEIDLWLTKPRTVAALVALAIFVGLGMAEFRSVYTAQQIDREMSARYISMLDLSSR
ncbi:MAG: hypothetical protein QM790_10915 [Nibricoccus sp.]